MFSQTQGYVLQGHPDQGRTEAKLDRNAQRRQWQGLETWISTVLRAQGHADSHVDPHNTANERVLHTVPQAPNDLNVNATFFYVLAQFLQ